MDNSQFRNLIQKDQHAVVQDAAATPRDFKKPALGSKTRASIPMTPRSITGQNASKLFAQQLEDYRIEHDGQPPAKKLKSSAPKGSKFGAGYHDRTQARREGEVDSVTRDDKQKRLKALEEMFKLQQIDEATFENLKTEIGIGGDLSSTHLVKGLDWKLLERSQRGDDLNNAPEPERKEEPRKADVDEELDQVLEKEVQAKSNTLRREDNTTTEVGQPTTRDEILRRLKESRAQVQAPNLPEPVLNDRFKKVPSENQNKKKFVEVVNGRRREVLLVANRDGTTKRKTRWLDKEENTPKGEPTQPLGMEVPAEFLAKQKSLLREETADDEDDDIFKGVSDYNPLADMNSESDEDDSKAEPAAGVENNIASTSSGPRNYFGTSKQDDEAEDRTNPILKDPTLLSALKRAAGLQKREEEGGDDVAESDPGRAAKQQQMLARMKQQDQADAADMDLGFGESRFGDDDDDDGPVWKGDEESTKKSGRKRGPKKRKGDKNIVTDVTRVLHGREKKL